MAAQPDVPPLPRCCPSHRDWPVLAEHLLTDFPDATINAVVRELGQARAAVTELSLDDEDALVMAETIARHKLMLLTGQVNDVARLDPERHELRRP